MILHLYLQGKFYCERNYFVRPPQSKNLEKRVTEIEWQTDHAVMKIRKEFKEKLIENDYEIYIIKKDDHNN